MRATTAFFAVVLIFAVRLAEGQTAAAPAGVPAVLLSDPHFDPFYDPAKVERLAAVPYTGWPAILAEADSSDRAAAYAKLNQTCGARSSDSSYALLTASLKAAHEFSPQARFVTVTGDLIAHNFDCHFRTLLPGRSPVEYRGFVEKTIRFVAAELRRAFPATPIYTLLGNNDSDCGDYQLDPGSAFLRDLAPVIVNDLALATGSARRKALASFAAKGDYSLDLPTPVRRTRLIALSDIYQSARYMGCNGKPNPAAGAQQIAWLRAQLTAARQQHQQVWVIGHVPPGIDLYSTLLHGRAVCSGQPPETFLASTALDEALLSGAGVIRVALFAHTHMDEMHLLPAPSAADGIAIKQVNSISPSNGNKPTVTTAVVDPASATLLDYSVYLASNNTGRGATWSKEYSFRESYHQPAFNALTLNQLTAEFLADRGAAKPESRTYLRTYFAGDLGRQLSLAWPAYVCTFTHSAPGSFTECMCQTEKK